ncbi:MAG: class I SAM-dependent methyltransferase [Gammaproteobacteria bacterium]|nr:class I SAM-dependent methyltransferase [Gammaproteobacteria bacterium]
MPSNEISTYYDDSESRETRPELRLATNLVNGPKVAIDCGCGAGSDIAFLRANDFTVHAFDIEEEAIIRCASRFERDENVFLSRSSFLDYSYPSASLIVADASLFFCRENEFSEIWSKMNQALLPCGVISVSFLGPDDTMAGPLYDKEKYWPHVLALTKGQVESLFLDYKIESFTEHTTSGTGPDGKPHHWHIFSVVAVKFP